MCRVPFGCTGKGDMSMQTAREAAAWISTRRKELELSMQELADMSDTAQSTVHYIEAGERMPSCETAAAIYRALGFRLILNAGGKDSELSTAFVREQLNAAKEGYGLTNRQLASITGISPAMVERYCKAHYRIATGINYATAYRIAEGLDWTTTLEKIEEYTIQRVGSGGKMKPKFRGRDIGRPSEEYYVDPRVCAYIDAQVERNRKKRKDWAIDHDAVKAKELGLSYGMYIQYRDTGYLPRYLEQRKAAARRDKDAAVIVSDSIRAGSHGSARTAGIGATKL